ncbi:Uncharacterised protein [Corynebacterium kutscheri]|uniref:Uncharacterized protein n=1 Tax=Corynebacterium kutscheri TaxID=35755 RepID=A0AB38VSC2_9CORY|nr:hypothetical protein [Corynebacterium kutscheri]VEH06991.1 Uncharacterised protein [Corynebacterium kutscheri]VEH09400.1 Uncharacterised protein [Corynebacterium kutscheri]VEH79486.1 Uncharacterised protein [Corynebacterium kutscheri]
MGWPVVDCVGGQEDVEVVGCCVFVGSPFGDIGGAECLNVDGEGAHGFL